MLLGTEVVLSPGDTMFDGEPVPPIKRSTAASPLLLNKQRRHTNDTIGLKFAVR